MSGVPLGNLAYGAFTRRDGAGGAEPRLGARITGGAVVDLAAAAAHGLLGDEGDLVRGPSLNPLLQAGRPAWEALHARVASLAVPPVATDAIELHLPFVVGDYVDFYSSLEHATNLGRILRPDDEPLLPNWRHVPVGYHGRSSTVAVSGTPVHRPRGQTRAAGSASPAFGPTRMLDIEVEVGFVTGDGPPLGHAIDVARAEDHIFGLVLVNDWSARDVQSWEYQPLGPFLAKSFLTSVSPWVVPLAALASFRVDGPAQEPAPLPYLRAAEPRGLDLRLEATIQTAAMRRSGAPPARLTAASFAGMYWSMAQQLAHLTANGATIRAGDLCASGTVSGSTPGSEGSLMELTWRGTRPLALPGGEERSFLEDGDEVTIRGWCGEGPTRVDLGEVTGRVEPAPASA